MAQGTRDTSWPCWTDAASCVPVGPWESLKKETVQPVIGTMFCCGADDWLQPGELGYTKCFSKEWMTLFTASQGILVIECQWSRYSFNIMQHPCNSLMI